MKIPLRAKLNCSLTKLIATLSNYPNLHLFSKGTELRYAIDCGSNFYLFRFGPDYIIEEVYSGDSPIYHLTEALIRMMSVVAYLGDSYSVRVESIFPYLISALAGKQIESGLPKPQAKSGSDLILAKRIMQIKSSFEKLQSENALLRKETARLLFHLILAESAKGPFNSQAVSKKYSVDGLAIKNALGISGSLGYRVVSQNPESLILVRE